MITCLLASGLPKGSKVISWLACFLWGGSCARRTSGSCTAIKERGVCAEGDHNSHHGQRVGTLQLHAIEAAWRLSCTWGQSSFQARLLATVAKQLCLPTDVTLPLEASRYIYKFPKNGHQQDFWIWLIPAQHLMPQESHEQLLGGRHLSPSTSNPNSPSSCSLH